MKTLLKIILILTMMIVLPIPALAQQEKPIEAPENFEEAGSLVGRFIEKIPEALENSWQGAKDIWEKTWLKWWNESIHPWLEDIWQRICILFGKEIEERKPIIEEEFKKETEEMKEDIKKETAKQRKNLWEWIKGLVKESL